VAVEPIDLDEARRQVLASAAPLGREDVDLGAAHGRVLATAVRAGENVPGFDNSAMDGYAVRSADIAEAGKPRPVTLRLGGEARAGAPAEAAVGEGEAIAISTGAMLPSGADAVVRLEDTSAPAAGEVEIRAAAEAGANVRRAGEDLRAGEPVLEKGTVLGAAELGVLSSAGVATPSCLRRPRVAVLTTGDELRGPADDLPPGGVRNTNLFAVPALVRESAAECVAAGTVGDDEERTAAALEGALERADALVVCGGVSVGAHDHVRPVLARIGVEERFWRVALKPGKPTYFGTRGEQLVFGLPGNPVSAIVTFLLLARPALLALAGRDPAADRLTATLAEPIARLPQRAQAVRVELGGSRGAAVARPTGPQGSHVLSSMLGADGLALVAAGEGELGEGEPVEVELLPRPC
jgi:molybdopterin molybdotransferase